MGSNHFEGKLQSSQSEYPRFRACPPPQYTAPTCYSDNLGSNHQTLSDLFLWPTVFILLCGLSSVCPVHELAASICVPPPVTDQRAPTSSSLEFSPFVFVYYLFTNWLSPLYTSSLIAQVLKRLRVQVWPYTLYLDELFVFHVHPWINELLQREVTGVRAWPRAHPWFLLFIPTPFPSSMACNYQSPLVSSSLSGFLSPTTNYYSMSFLVAEY